MHGRAHHLLASAASAIAVSLAAACSGANVNVAAGYQPPAVPVEFTVDFAFHPDGTISVGVGVSLVTDLGIFSVSANYEQVNNPPPDETLLVIRHKTAKGIVDNAYSIATGEEVAVSINGSSILQIGDRKVFVDATRAVVRYIKVTNAPGAQQSSPAPAGPVSLVRTISSDQATLTLLTWSPDGSMIATADSTGGSQTPHVSQVWRVADGTLVATHSGQDCCTDSINWSPDGRFIATGAAYGGAGGASSVHIWDALTGQTVTVLTTEYTEEANWSPDSKYVVLSGAPDAPSVWNAATGAQVSTYQGNDAPGSPAAWSPRGDLIASGAVIWNGLTGAEVNIYAAAAGNPSYAYFSASYWSPDGRDILSGAQVGDLILWDAATGATVWDQQVLASDTLGSASWSPNGKYAVWTNKGNNPSIVDTTTGNQVASVGGNYFNDTVDDVAWSPDGQYIATASGGAIQIWKAPS